jgi:tetratricopeptide (TPR) repeat protein
LCSSIPFAYLAILTAGGGIARSPVTISAFTCPTTAVAAPFVDPLKNYFAIGTEHQRVAGHLPGALLAHQCTALPIPLSIAPALLVLAVSVAAAEPRASRDPIALARAGAAAIEDRRFGEALELFTEAATMRPGDASLCFGAGVAAFMLGQNDVAQTRFECALALKPSYLPPAVWLGELHYRAGRLHDAIAIYDTARQRYPGRRELPQRLADWRKEQELQSRFNEARTAHFTVLFEGPTDEPLARVVVERLEAAYWRVGAALGVYPPQPVTVVLYTREQFGDITRLAAWAAAAYDGRIRVPLGGALEQPEELDRVLSHEFVHAMVAILGGRTVPAWVNEGLATVLEPGPDAAQATLARTNVRPELSKLHRSFVGLSARDAEIAYASAAMAVRRLIEQRGVAALVALLEDLGRGAQFASAFQQRIAMRYEDFAALAARD